MGDSCPRPTGPIGPTEDRCTSAKVSRRGCARRYPKSQTVAPQGLRTKRASALTRSHSGAAFFGRVQRLDGIRVVVLRRGEPPDEVSFVSGLMPVDAWQDWAARARRFRYARSTSWYHGVTCPPNLDPSPGRVSWGIDWVLIGASASATELPGDAPSAPPPRRRPRRRAKANSIRFFGPNRASATGSMEGMRTDSSGHLGSTPDTSRHHQPNREIAVKSQNHAVTVRM